MIATLKKLFENIEFNPTEEQPGITPEVAVGALLVEVMMADHDNSETEKIKIKELLLQKFELSEATVNTIFNSARDEATQATDYYKFTRVINDNFSVNDKIEVVSFLWQVAKADGTVDSVEEHVIRRIADLLHLRHAEYIKAKER